MAAMDTTKSIPTTAENKRNGEEFGERLDSYICRFHSIKIKTGIRFSLFIYIHVEQTGVISVTSINLNQNFSDVVDENKFKIPLTRTLLL